MDHNKVIDYINELNNNNIKHKEKIEYLTNHIKKLEENRNISDLKDGVEKDLQSNKDKFMNIYSKLQLCIKTINNVDIKNLNKEDIMTLYNNCTKENLIFLYNNFDDYLN